MTHGDKDKAKKPASKASGKSSGKAIATGKGLKTLAKGVGKTLDAGKKAGPSKSAAGQKGGSTKADTKGPVKTAGKGGNGEGGKPLVKDRTQAKTDAGASTSAAQGKPPRGPADAGPAGFNNPRVADAFKRAIKKYPNAFRRLTD